MASNDVYWEYEETGIRIRQADGRPLYMGAAWKNDKLYLIRLEGSHNGNGVFPRAWAEDNPIWDSSYITKKLQKTSKQTRNKLIRPGRLVKGGREFLLIRKQVDIRPSLFLPPTTPWHR